MTQAEFFDAWAPETARWSRWAKPLLFSYMSRSVAGGANDVSIRESQESNRLLRGQLPPADGPTGLIVDLAGVLSVRAGLMLAEMGYRPVPLFNSLPSPQPDGLKSDTADVLVDMREVISALQDNAAHLRTLSITADAPPAFLLDSRRGGDQEAAPVRPGVFDNRSVSMPTDFPSGHYIRTAGVSRVVVVREHDSEPASDLAQTLMLWHEARIEIYIYSLDNPNPPRPSTIAVKGGFWRTIYRFLCSLAGPDDFLRGSG